MPAAPERRRPFWYLRRRSHVLRREVDEELRFHIDLRIEEFRARGLSEEEARRAAYEQFGNVDGTRQYCIDQDRSKERHMLRQLAFQDLAQDVRISARSLLRVPVLTATILATVGLGIGATTVIYSAVDAALLRPLPYAEPDRLVRIYTDAPPNKFRFSLVDYLALEAQQTHFDQVAVYSERSMAFTDGVVAERLRGRLVSWTYFPVLGLQPAMGRAFTAADARPGGAPAVIVSHGFWQQRLSGRLDVIGQSIRLDGRDHVVTGVLPQTAGPLEQRQDYFIAAQFEPPRRKGPFSFIAIARLRAGADRGAAAEELRAINRRLFPLWKSSYQDDRATWSMVSLQEHVVGDVGTIAGLALAAVGLVWLIACANASNLLVARVASRRRELAVRTALGASRARVMRYLFTESCLLAAGSAAFGLLVTWLGIDLLQSAGATYFPRTAEVALEGRVLWVLAALTAFSALLFGIIPALHGAGGPVDQSLRSLGRSSTGDLSVRRLRALLVGSQFAIATPLLVVAGLLFASLNQLRQVELGFDGRTLLTGLIQLTPAQFPEQARAEAFLEELKQRIQALPGISGVALADGRPPVEAGDFNNFDLEDFPAGPGRSQHVTAWVGVSPEYFGVVGLKLIEGRLLDERDRLPDSPGVVVVDRAWAKRFFPSSSAIGKRFRSGGCTDCPWTTVVGVVSEVKYEGLDKPDGGTIYNPLSSAMCYLLIRTAGDPNAMLPTVRETIRALNPTLPFSNVATIEELVEQSLQRPRSLSLLVGSFAAVALLLSIIGIYGVMSYYVQQHAKDMAIRLALGGTRGRVLGLIVRQGMQVVVFGVAAGVAVALLATRLMSSVLFGVGAADAVTVTAAAATLLSVAALGCFVPARRAMGMQPAAVLRNE